MLLRYSTDSADLVAFAEHYYSNSPAIKRSTQEIQVIAVGYLVILFLVLWITPDTLLNIVVGLVFGVAFAAWLPRYSRRRYLEQLEEVYAQSRNASFVGTMEIQLSEDGTLIHRSEVSELRMRKDAIERVETTQHYVFIFMGPSQRLHHTEGSRD